MEQLKTVITAACMISLAVGLCNVLRPSRLFERQVRFLISLLFVLGISAPLLNLDANALSKMLTPTSAPVETGSLTQEMEQQLLAETALQAEDALRMLLSENGITCSEADVSVHIDEGQRIYISEVSAACSDVHSACEILRAALGEEVVLDVAEMDT